MCSFAEPPVGSRLAALPSCLVDAQVELEEVRQAEAAELCLADAAVAIAVGVVDAADHGRVGIARGVAQPRTDREALPDRKSTRLYSSYVKISYAVFYLT